MAQSMTIDVIVLKDGAKNDNYCNSPGRRNLVLIDGAKNVNYCSSPPDWCKE